MLDKILGIISIHLSIPVEELNAEMTFAELNMDSLNLMKIIMGIENIFDIHIEDEEIHEKEPVKPEDVGEERNTETTEGEQLIQMMKWLLEGYKKEEYQFLTVDELAKKDGLVALTRPRKTQNDRVIRKRIARSLLSWYNRVANKTISESRYSIPQ